MIYIYIGLLSLFFTTVYTFFQKRDINNPFFLLSFLLLFILGAVRYEVGTDYILYSNYQIPAILSSLDVKFEFLSKEIVKLGFLLSDNEHYQYIFVIYHFICVFFVFLAIKTQSKILSFSIFIYIFSGFFSFSLNGMRQAIAISIVLYAIKNIFEARLIWYVFYVTLASLFHKSAVLCILFIFLNKRTISLGLFIIISILTFLFLSLFKDVFYSFISYLGFYSEYIDSDFDTGAYNVTITIYGLVTFIVFYSLYILTNKAPFQKERIFFLNVSYIIALLSVIMPFIPNGYRIFYIFLPIQIIMFPNMLALIRKKSNIVFYYIVLSMIYIFFFTKTILVTNYNETLPYQVFPGFLNIEINNEMNYEL